MTYRLVYTRQASKDAQKIKEAGLKEKVKELLEIIAQKILFRTTPHMKN